MGKQKQEIDGRSSERLFAHYKVEKELADRLRRSSKEERLTLYTTVYDELYRRVHDHPQLLRRRSIEEREIAIASQMLLLNRFLFPEASFLEVGAGDCALSIHVAKMVARVYAVDVSRQISCTATLPENCQFVLSEGCSVGVPAGSIDVAYSYQLMEHLHPLDASEQLENIYAALAPGGRYVCVTPNKLSGPHDISRAFSSLATGLHLKEYTVGELSQLFKRVGFSRVFFYCGVRGRYCALPTSIGQIIEALLQCVPSRMRYALANSLPLRALLGIQLVGIKGE